MKYLRGYRAIALLQIIVSLAFFTTPAFRTYGTFFGVVNAFGAGVLLMGSLLAYFRPAKWILTLMIATMLCLIVFNTIWFFAHSAFLSTGFPLVAYDLLFVLSTLHFLGKGL